MVNEAAKILRMEVDMANDMAISAVKRGIQCRDLKIIIVGITGASLILRAGISSYIDYLVATKKKQVNYEQ